MPDITALEQRITAAFDRIDRGLDALARAKEAAPETDLEIVPDAAPESAAEPLAEPAPQMAAMLRALETARASSADWADRYRALEQQMGDETLAMAGEIARLTAALDAASQASPVHAASQGLDDRDAEIDELTARLAQQETELEQLRALRSAEAAEVDDLVAALAPLVEEAAYV